MASTIKPRAHELVDALPDDSTWDDLMRLIYERLLIEQGIADADAGRMSSNADVRRRYGLPA